MKIIFTLAWGILWFICIPPIAVSAQDKTAAKKQAKEIYIGIPNNRAPYSYLDKAKKPTGILVEALDAACREANAHCHYINDEFNQLIEKLHTQRLNAILVIDSALPSEGKPIRMTSPLCKSQPVIVQRRDNARKNPQDFKNATMGVGQDSLFQLHLPDEYRHVAHLRPYPIMESAVFDLTSGRIDALFTDKAFFEARIASTTLSSDENPSGLIAHAISAPQFPATSMRLMLRRQDQALFTLFEKPLQGNGKTPDCTDLLDD